MNQTVDPTRLALDNCDQEPIHRPGRIQPFGTLLAGPMDLTSIDYASENAAAFLGREAKDLLGRSFGDLLPRDVAHSLRNVLSMSTSARQRERAGQIGAEGRVLELFVHRNAGGQAVLEFEPESDPGAVTVENPIDRMRMMLAHAGGQRTLDRLLKACVTGLQDLVGYDRVMAYRYAENGDGEVVAEACRPGVESFLGLRYPGWDVPVQARAMQVRNPIRMLSDIGQAPVGLLARGTEPDDLDISLAHLRGISPIHVEYLGNMGVGASLTISLVVEGRLWGMFACHHNGPRVIRSDLRIAAEIFGQMISLVIQQRLETEQSEGRRRAAEARRRIVETVGTAEDIASAFDDIAPVLRQVIPCDGLAVMQGEETLRSAGSVPSEEAMRAIGTRPHDGSDLVEHTEALGASGWAGEADLGPTAGCVHLRSTTAFDLQAMFFRDETLRNVRWAGNPDKTANLTTGPFGARLTPRGSFEAYAEQQRGRCEPWSPADVEAAEELRRTFAQIADRGARAQLARHKELVGHQRQQDLMIAELNHRVKNILALIRSLSRQAKASSGSLESYAQALEQRIGALAAAHDLAVSGSMKGVSLRNVIETELAPYMRADSGQIVMAGPPVGLRPDVAPMIALVFHEIVTNAAKYGALSTDEGVVQARWRMEEDGLHFTWKELGGPEVVPPERHGFGRSLIEKAIPYEFDGEATLDYAPTGVSLRFRLPQETLVDLDEDSTETVLVGEIGRVERVATDARALMVEDNVVLAMDMVESLTRLGAASVETAGTLKEALEKIGETPFDVAVLDMNLRGSVSFDAAEALVERGTPIIFVTGYGSSVPVPPSLRGVPVLTKPVDDATLSATLARVMRR